MIKRFAARVLRDGEGRKYSYSVVEVEGGIVKSFYPLIHELPATIWLNGEIILSSRSDLDKYVKEEPEMQALPYDVSLKICSCCFAYHLLNRKLIRLL